MIEIKAYGKINLTLEVLGLQADGFHEIKSIMQSIDLHDEIIMEETDDGKISLAGSSKELRYDDSNLIMKSARMLQSKYGIGKGASIFLKKKIPIEAGLAGGSSDAAGTLIGLNKLWKLNLSPEELSEIGERIGSDIPFTIFGGTALAEGRGEKITKLRSIEEEGLLIVKPDFGASTKRIYNEVDKNFKSRGISYTDLMLEAINKGKNYKGYLHNDLAEATIKLYPEVNSILEKFKDEGVLGLTSGSGPTCYCFSDNDSIKKLYNYFSKKYKNVFITRIKSL